VSGRRLHIRGLVQGVGFRPYVWRLASELDLNGWVRNDGGGVIVAVDGEKLPEFMRRLPLELPRLARIDAIDSEPAPVDASDFSIHDSLLGDVATAIGPDAAVCADCVTDLCNPAGTRWRYAFTNCTHCGPRYTVSRQIPYDRARTSLAPFVLCARCAAEYSTPNDRRFHAETTCCPACGPQLSLLDAAGKPLAGDAVAATLALLQAGRIVAIKGPGGFHLACDADNPAAVVELRQRKQRDAKPFAVMALNAVSLADCVEVVAEELALLNSAAAPVVLCARNVQPSALAESVAPGLAHLGLMLPATPLHLLLWHEAAGRPGGSDWLAAAHPLRLVMTSANPHSEPLVIGNDEALARLSGIADAYLLHDRDIVMRCDDSVLRAGPGFIRRARGYVPLPIMLADEGPTVVALGGYLKNTVCVLKGREAFLSQHVGSLDNAAAIDFLEETVRHLLAILDVRPELIAHDLHPDYPSTQLALRLAEEFGVPALAVPHHQAHVAAIGAEYGVTGPLLGLALDGVGLGPDGQAWGGELLRLDGARCERLGHLSALKLPGGDRAALEPWRMGLAALHAAGMDYRVGGWLMQRYPEREGGPLLTMLGRNLRCPPTSSLGRWFDAAAGLLGVCEMSAYEGQAAMLLEAQASLHGPVPPLKDGYRLLPDGTLDLTPLVPALLICHDAPAGAALFHATVAAGLAAWAMAAVDGKNGAKIAVGGGCAMNRVLITGLRQQLKAVGVELLEARLAPPNDGGLALGQGALARRMFKEMKDVSGHSGSGG